MASSAAKGVGGFVAVGAGCAVAFMAWRHYKTRVAEHDMRQHQMRGQYPDDMNAPLLGAAHLAPPKYEEARGTKSQGDAPPEYETAL